jgi:hypothetical protein
MKCNSCGMDMSCGIATPNTTTCCRWVVMR